MTSLPSSGAHHTGVSIGDPSRLKLRRLMYSASSSGVVAAMAQKPAVAAAHQGEKKGPRGGLRGPSRSGQGSSTLTGDAGRGRVRPRHPAQSHQYCKDTCAAEDCKTDRLSKELGSPVDSGEGRARPMTKL